MREKIKATKLAVLITQCRKNANLTQQQVADAVGKKRSAYAYYETGKSEPSLKVLNKLARFYNINVATLAMADEDVATDAQKYESIDEVENISENFNQLSDIEKAFLLKFRLLNLDQKDELLECIKKLNGEV